MKLYFQPASTTCRMVMLFAAENSMPLEMQLVDLLTGEHDKAPFEAINPNHLVPVLEDGDFRLTESAAILNYHVDKTGSPLYPKDRQARAGVNERMDWINAQLYRDLAYGTVYPQIFPFHKGRSDEAQDATVQWGRERARGWLRVLDQNFLGSNEYLCGAAPTIADDQASAFVALAEPIGCDFAEYPNVKRWLGRMKSLLSWKQVNEAIDGFAATLKGQPMVSV